MNSPLAHCAIYRRVSTTQQIDGFSLQDQFDKLSGLAESNGWTWIDFEDAGRSGETLDRPALAELLSRLHEFDAVLVVDDSRLAREEVTSALIRQKLRDSNTRLVTLSGSVDLNNPQDQFSSAVIGAAHQLEQRLRTQKMVAGHRRTAEAGFWTGGPAPFGYQITKDPNGSPHKMLQINEAEAAFIREAVSLVLDKGLSTYKATAVLNANGYRTRSGTRWHYRNVIWQLKKPVLSGTHIYNSETGPIEIAVPPIIERSTWEHLQKAVKGKATGKPRKNNFYPLTGHLDCPCGGHLSGFPRPNGRSYKCSRNKPEYADRRCDQYPRYRHAEPLEERIWEEVKGVLTDEQYLHSVLSTHLTATSAADTMGANQSDALRRLIASRREEQVKIVRDYASQGLAAELVKAATDEIAADIAALQSQLAQAEHWNQLRHQKSDALSALSALAKRARFNLENPTPELMREVFELLELRVLVDSDDLSMTGTLPVDAWIDSGASMSELATGTPRPL